jgi:hypothetical protein
MKSKARWDDNTSTVLNPRQSHLPKSITTIVLGRKSTPTVALTRPQLHLITKTIYHILTTHACDKQKAYNHKCILIARYKWTTICKHGIDMAIKGNATPIQSLSYPDANYTSISIHIGSIWSRGSVRLVFVLTKVLYIVNGLDRIIRLLLENRFFERSRTNKQVKPTNMSQYKI